MKPKVFLSHASEDKERFVTDFAKKLRKHGIDAWLDKWEMLPGDSLVDKIFEEGLKEADAVVVILSKFSVNKPWVREELNVSIVNRISKGTKIIPILLDDCKVPEALTSTLWEEIDDLNDYEESFKRIRSSIFGVNNKPPLGTPPDHTSSVYNEIGGLTKADNLILKESCDYAVNNNLNSINPAKLFADGNDLGFARSEIKDCIEILEDHEYLDVTRLSGTPDEYRCRYDITAYGFNKYAEAYRDGYKNEVDNIVSAIVNEGLKFNTKLNQKLEIPIYVVNKILEYLKHNGHISITKTVGGDIIIDQVSASLRRTLR